MISKVGLVIITVTIACIYVAALLGISIAKAVLIVLLQTVAAQGLYLWLETWRMLALYYLGVIR